MKRVIFLLLICNFNFFGQENAISIKPFSEYVDGRIVKTLEDSDMIVSTSLKEVSRNDGKYFTFNVILTNKTYSKTILVENFKAYVVNKKKTKEVAVLTRKEYIKIKERRAALRAGLAAAAGSIAAEQAGTKTTYSDTYSSGTVNTNISGNIDTNSNVYDSYGTYSGNIYSQSNLNANVNSSYYGSSSTYKTEVDGEAVQRAQQQSNEQVAQMAENAKQARQQWNDEYLKNNTLRKGQTMGGLVNVKYSKGNSMVIKIIVDNLEYSFEWNPKEAEF